MFRQIVFSAWDELSDKWLNVTWSRGMSRMSGILILSYRLNPNSIIHHQTSQKLSPKHAARGVAQSPYPIYRHGKACLSKQPLWRAAGDPRLAHGRSPVRAPGPAGALRALFFLHPPFLPPSGDSFFRTFPTKPTKVLGLKKWQILMFFIVFKLQRMFIFPQPDVRLRWGLDQNVAF